ncbi:MAG: hypothetical protein HRU38_24120 [Saccharospirillaceae bacterium]|nr:hypothetical protein [Pseudomonadales bacterium]NRB81709.1 hypothetical protein [Saccharospirillaceae bacterium]
MRKNDNYEYENVMKKINETSQKARLFKSVSLITVAAVCSTMFVGCFDFINEEKKEDTVIATQDTQTLTGTDTNTESTTDTDTDTNTNIETDADVIVSTVDDAVEEYNGKLNMIWEGIFDEDTAEETITTIDGVKVTTQVFSCPVSGTITFIQKSNNEVSYTSESCLNENGEVSLELSRSINGEYDYSFRAISELGLWSLIVVATDNNKGQSLTITDEAGEQYSYSELENSTYYEVNGASVLINQLPRQFEENSQCAYFYENETIVNDGESIITLGEIDDLCLVNTASAFKESRAWTQKEATLVYSVTLIGDEFSASQDLNIALISQDLTSQFTVTVKDESGVEVSYFSSDSAFQFQDQFSYLSAGQYTVEILHVYSDTEIPELFVQIDALNSNVVFLEEIDPPMTIAEIELSTSNSYLLEVEQAGTFIFNVDADLATFDIRNEKGIILNRFFFYENWGNDPVFLESGDYYITEILTPISTMLYLKSYSDNSAQLSVADNATVPETVTLNTPYSTNLDNDYTVGDYSLAISPANYLMMIDVFESIDIPNIELESELKQGAVSTNTSSNLSNSVETAVYSCEVSGTFVVKITRSLDGQIISSTYDTELCVQNGGLVEYHSTTLDGNNRPQSVNYSYVQSDGNTMAVEYAESLSRYYSDDEYYIDVENLGSFFVRGDSWSQNYFGADGTFLKVSGEQSVIDENERCLFHNVKEHNLNDNIFDVELSDQDYCVSNYDFEIDRGFQKIGNILEYTMTVENDATAFDAVFLTTDQEYDLLVKVIDSSGQAIKSSDYFGSYYASNLETMNTVLDAGVYTLLLQDDTNYGALEGQIYAQLKADNTMFEFVGEHEKPEIELGKIEGVWSQANPDDSVTMVIDQETIYTLHLISGSFTTMQVENADGELIFSNNRYRDRNEVSYKFPAGVYIVKLMSDDPESKSYDFTLTSHTADSATISVIDES